MTEKQKAIHKRAVHWANTHKEAEKNLVEVFIDVEETKLYEEFNKGNIYLYGTDVLGLSHGVTYMLMSVSRKAKLVPEFRKAIVEDRVSLSKAARIAPHVEKDVSLIEFAATHSKREIEIEVSKLNPNPEIINKVKFVGGGMAQVTVTIPIEDLEALERTQSLLAQRNLPASLSDAVGACEHQYIDRKDPVKRAERNVTELCPGRTGELNAAEKNATLRRDQGRCTELDHNGKRCNSDRWVDVHHIIPREMGGTNDLCNLRTLCRFHHRQHHRASSA